MVSRGLRNNRGLTFVEVLIGTGLVTVGAMALILYQTQIIQSSAQLDIYKQMSEMRIVLHEQISSDAGWSQLVAEPANHLHACIQANQQQADACPLETANALTIPGTGRAPLVKTSDQSYGFMPDLSPCTTFNQTGSTCQMRAEATWRAVCSQAGTCTQAEITVTFQLADALKQTNMFNPSAFSFKVYRNVNLGATLPPGTWQESFTVQSTLTREDPLFDVFLIIDNSESMADNREKLITALMGFVDALQGFNVRYRLYSTTSMLDYSWWIPSHQNYIYQQKQWVVGSGTYTEADGRVWTGAYNQSYLINSSNPPLSFEGDLMMDVDWAAMNGKTLIQQYNTADLTQLKTDLAEQIRALNSSGASAESGMCTASRIIMDQGPNAPVDPNNKAIFVIISDEDDASAHQQLQTRYSCAGKIRLEKGGRNNVMSSCDPATETCTGKRVHVSSKRSYETHSWATYRKVDTVTTTVNGTCSSYDPLGCGPEGNFPCDPANIPPPPDASGWVLQSCTKNTQSTVRGGVHSIRQTDVADGNLNRNFCTDSNLPIFGGNYANFKAYLTSLGNDMSIYNDPIDCYENWAKDTYSFNLKSAILDSGNAPIAWNEAQFKAEQDQLYLKIPNLLRVKYGANGYSFMTVIHDPAKDADAGCALDPTSGSYGTYYKQALLATDTPGNLHSICADSYGSSFANLRQVVIETALSSFPLTNYDPATDRIESISVTRGGTAVSFGPSDWTISGSTITFNPGILQSGDVVRVIMARQ